MHHHTSPIDPISNTINGNYFETIRGITSDKNLRQIISNYPKMLDKRIQNTLDHLSIEFIDVSQLVILAFSGKQNRMLPLKVGQVGLSIRDKQHFSFPKTKASSLIFDDHSPLYASLYFIAKGLGHGLRINGYIIDTDTNTYLFKIEQVYFHCARAAARSELWSNEVQIKSENLNKDNFIEHAPFLLLKTLNKKGETELSPRGDNAGFVKFINSNTLLLPERPGNKIAVSLRNIILQPTIELLFMVPSSDQTLSILGVAKVINDKQLLKQCTVNGKIPKLGTLIQIKSTCLQSHKAINESQIWVQENTPKPSITSFSKALSAHINGEGLVGKATNVIVDIVVKHDMKNLY